MKSFRRFLGTPFGVIGIFFLWVGLCICDEEVKRRAIADLRKLGC